MDINNKIEISTSINPILKAFAARFFKIKILLLTGENGKAIKIIDGLLKFLPNPDAINLKAAGIDFEDE